MRSCPSTTECEVIKTIQGPSLIEISATSGDWYKVSKIEEETISGWFYSSLISFDTDSYFEEKNNKSLEINKEDPEEKIIHVPHPSSEVVEVNNNKSVFKKVFEWFKNIF